MTEQRSVVHKAIESPPALLNRIGDCVVIGRHGFFEIQWGDRRSRYGSARGIA